jgi:hypothetical protein
MKVVLASGVTVLNKGVEGNTQRKTFSRSLLMNVSKCKKSGGDNPHCQRYGSNAILTL